MRRHNVFGSTWLLRLMLFKLNRLLLNWQAIFGKIVYEKSRDNSLIFFIFLEYYFHIA